MKWAHTTDNSGGGGGGEGADNGDAGTNNCRGAASSSSNEKLVVAIRAGDERERLERMWEEVKHCQLCVDEVVEARSKGEDRQRRQRADHV